MGDLPGSSHHTHPITQSTMRHFLPFQGSGFRFAGLLGAGALAIATWVSGTAIAQAQTVVIENGQLRLGIGGSSPVTGIYSRPSRSQRDRDLDWYYQQFGQYPYGNSGVIIDSTLINPVIVDSPIIDSTLINPVIIQNDSLQRGDRIPSRSVPGNCSLFGSIRAACNYGRY